MNTASNFIPERGINLVQNGGFESTPSIVRSWSVFSSGIEGWSVTEGAGVEIQTRGVGGISSYSGQNIIELDSHGRSSNSAISQDITTGGEHSFTLSFAYTPRPSTSQDSNQVEVLWNGNVIATITGDKPGWNLYEYEVTGSSESETTGLTFRATGTQDTRGGLLDNVSLTLNALAPEPQEPETETATQEASTLSQMTRLTYTEVGAFEAADMNGDGQLDMLSIGGAYGPGVVWFDGADFTSINRLTYSDPGNYQIIDMNGDGAADILSDALGGIGYFDGASGAFTRISYVDLGASFLAADMDANGAVDIISDASALGGTIMITADGAISRISYNTLGNFEVGNFDSDSDLEIMSNNGAYGNGSVINGLITYDIDGTHSRYSYYQSNEFIVADVDDSGVDEIISTNTTNFIGSGVILNDGSFDRIAYFDADHFEYGDIDGDGSDDLVAISAYYSNGAPVGGVISFDVETGAVTRHSYVGVEAYEFVDFDGDGNADLITSGGTFGSGLVQFDGDVVV